MQKLTENQECCSGDMLTDRETHRHAHHNTLPPTGGEETNRFLHALHSLELKVYHRRPEAVSDTRVTVSKNRKAALPQHLSPLQWASPF